MVTSSPCAAVSGASALILAGGLGTRLRGVTGDAIPKALAEINGVPFLDYLLHDIANTGLVSRVTLSLHHYAEMIQARYGDAFAGMRLNYCVDNAPLGTGGAIASALPAIEDKNAPLLICNGDCLAEYSLKALFETHARAQSAACTLALSRVEDASRYGAVTFGADGRITAFAAAGAKGPAYINAGRYACTPAQLAEILPDRESFSIEHDIFTPAAEKGLLRAAPFEGAFIDIGVPDDYAEAQYLIPSCFPLPAAARKAHI